MILIEAARRRQARRRRALVRASVVLLMVAAAGLAVRDTGSGHGRHGSGLKHAGRQPRSSSFPSTQRSQLTAATMPVCFRSSVADPALVGSGTMASVVPVGYPSVVGSSYPFAVRVAPNGRWSFVSTVGAYQAGVDVFSDQTAAPHFVRSVSVPDTLDVRLALGEAITRDGKYLLVAADQGAAVIDLARAESGSPHALLGVLKDPSISFSPWLVAVSPDDRYVFVTSPRSGEVAVFDLARAIARGFGPSDLIGVESIPAPQDVAVSPAGNWLYVTSYPSSLYVVNLEKRASAGDLHTAAFPVQAVVTAGCFLNRIATSANGSLVWVTSSLDNELLGFSSAKLRSHPADALVATVRVGDYPDGLALFDHGRRVAVADGVWGAFGTAYPKPPKGASSNVAIVSVKAALAGKPALLGAVRSGTYPRSVTATANGTRLFVVNSASAQLEVIDARATGS